MELKIEEIKAIEPIKSNIQELKKELEIALKKYENLVYTSENINTAKKDRANLNKLEKAINDEKIRIKKLILQEYEDEFEPQCKELIEMIRNVNTKIDKQIKEFEQKEDEEKRAQIISYRSETIKEYNGLISFETIFKKQWLNKTYGMDKIQDDINHIISKTKIDMETIDVQILDEKLNKQAKTYYFNNICKENILSITLQEIKRIQEQEQKIEELKKQKFKEDIIKNMVELAQEQKVGNRASAEIAHEQEEEKIIVRFEISATMAQLNALKQYFKENGIQGKMIKNNKKLILNYSNRKDFDGFNVISEGISNKEEDVYFGVSNLSGCPEDAIIGRDLFDTDDYVKALKKGMELARKGYSEIVLQKVDNEEDN